MRAVGAGAERVDVRREVNHSVRRHDGAGLEGELHAAVDFPAGDLDGVRVRVGQTEVLLRLVPGGRIIFDRRDHQAGIGGLREGDARVVRAVQADRFQGVADAMGHVEMGPPRDNELADHVADPVGEPLVRTEAIRSAVWWPAPFLAVQERFGPEEVGHAAHPAIEHGQERMGAGRLQELIHQGAHPAQQHLARFWHLDDHIVHAIEAGAARD